MNVCLKNKIRTDLMKVCTKEQLDKIKMIENQATCAEQALGSYAKVPEGEAENIPAFVMGALRSKAEALFCRDEWWDEMLLQYKLRELTTMPIYVDFGTGMFYTLELIEE
jgi:hypothetical protein